MPSKSDRVKDFISVFPNDTTKTRYEWLDELKLKYPHIGFELSDVANAVAKYPCLRSQVISVREKQENLTNQLNHILQENDQVLVKKTKQLTKKDLLDKIFKVLRELSPSEKTTILQMALTLAEE